MLVMSTTAKPRKARNRRQFSNQFEKPWLRDCELLANLPG